MSELTIKPTFTGLSDFISTGKLKAAVIGVGSMGRNHARVYNDLPDVKLVAVADTDLPTAAEVGTLYGVTSYEDAGKMLDRERPDIVSVATPTIDHRNSAGLALSAGCHVLIEKPIAATVKEANELIIKARQFNRVLAVGHIERFNPAAMKVKEMVENGAIGEVYSIGTRRLGPSPVRIRDVGVAVDLAVHDIDLMLWLLHSTAVTVGGALTIHREHDHLEDGVAALLRFSCGAVGILQANWLTRAKVRDLVVVGRDGTIVADLGGGRVTVWRSPTESEEHLTLGHEPLRVELQRFVEAAHGGPIAVTGEDGLRALHLALHIARGKGASG